MTWQKGCCASVVDCGSKRQYSLVVEKPCHATRLIFLVMYDDLMPQFARDSVWIRCLVTGPDCSSEVHRSITVSFYFPCVLFTNLNIFRVLGCVGSFIRFTSLMEENKVYGRQLTSTCASKACKCVRATDSYSSPFLLHTTKHQPLQTPTFLWLQPKRWKCHHALGRNFSVILPFPAHYKGWKCGRRWVMSFTVQRVRGDKKSHWIRAATSGDLAKHSDSTDVDRWDKPTNGKLLPSFPPLVLCPCV